MCPPRVSFGVCPMGRGDATFRVVRDRNVINISKRLQGEPGGDLLGGHNCKLFVFSRLVQRVVFNVRQIVDGGQQSVQIIFELAVKRDLSGRSGRSRQRGRSRRTVAGQPVHLQQNIVQVLGGPSR